ncbi:SGF29 tudor-like domain-containing protein [Schizophyllum amplum]|uniref:SGF29 tudor-like domain-containing protein n=1 Tax=Schizophyllum amplum TaxID=97359 RepID=A0A550C795_9AGAR|nr:SGF29 tudor-like domain-containing protein [Auriculariopsis ampla]
MDRRRTPGNRPASSEEVQCWSHAASSIGSLNDVYATAQTKETIGRANRLIAVWPEDDVLPVDGYEGLKRTAKKLMSALNEIRQTSDREVKAIDDTIERLGVIMALRKHSEALPPPRDGRIRARGDSPVVTANGGAASAPATSRGVSITLPARSPAPMIPFSRDPKLRREALAKQLPLQEGRRVAFHPPQNKAGGSATDEDNAWIMAIVVKSINADKNRYIVRDAEPSEAGPAVQYNTTLRGIIPLPDADAPPASASHLNAYPEFTQGSAVLALYPDTSCFYRAEVVASPKDLAREKVRSRIGVPSYKLKFDDDENQEHIVPAHVVVEWPMV